MVTGDEPNDRLRRECSPAVLLDLMPSYMGRYKGTVMHRSVLLVLGIVVCLTVVNHIWWLPVLRYPLFPGIAVHNAVTGDRLAGATDAHGGTLAEERTGFLAEILVNVGLYFLLATAMSKWWPWPRAARRT